MRWLYRAVTLLFFVVQLSVHAQAMESAKNLLSGDAASAGNSSGAAGNSVMVIMQTGMGDIEIALNQSAAPLSVANFLRYT
ncbi:MAG: hypothetical protein HKO07_04615, partial [Pseudomonadales bacterium]|nr:hypothetical protein [Pseudomonadales bacterium]